jgi:hypothetical protein
MPVADTVDFAQNIFQIIPMIKSVPMMMIISHIGIFYYQRLVSSIELAVSKQVVGPEQVRQPEAQGKH